MGTSKHLEQLDNHVLLHVALFATALLAYAGVLDHLMMSICDVDFFCSTNLYFLIFLAAVVLLPAYCRFVTFSRPGQQVAASLGAVPVPLRAQDSFFATYRSVVEEVAEVASIPIPALYIDWEDTSINAFTAGMRTDTAALCVSKGALEQLSPLELKGVVAHEMAHIHHQDVGWTVRLIAVTCGLLSVVNFGMEMCGTRKNSKGEDESGAVLGIPLLLIGLLGWLIAGMLEAAASRAQEFRADAQAASWMSSPDGIVGALVKLHLTSGRTKTSEQLCALHFGAAARRFWFDSHPPLLKRIRALDPQRADALARGGLQ